MRPHFVFSPADEVSRAVVIDPVCMCVTLAFSRFLLGWTYDFAENWYVYYMHVHCHVCQIFNRF